MEEQSNVYVMEKKRPFIHKRRIRFIKGEYKGELRLYADEYADDLIKRGMAEEVKE